MAYQPFYERFPEIAREETRSFTMIGNPDLAGDEFGLIELYCNDRNCDCRRVLFNVLSRKREQTVAVIAYGWESRDYYVRWFGEDDPRAIAELKGPALNTASRQSELAPAPLDTIQGVLAAPGYVERLKRHYRMFKETVDGPAPSRARQKAKSPRVRGKKRKR